MDRVLFVLLCLMVTGCTIKKEYILNPDGTPPDVERVVVEGPGGDMVSVGIEILERIAPLLPEPWNSIMVALLAGFSAATATWVFRSRKKKEDGSE